MTSLSTLDQRPGRRAWRLLATCSRGLEGVVGAELRAMGAAGVEEGRGVVEFSGGLEEVYRANVGLRAAMRVLLHLTQGEAGGREALFALASAVAWEDWVRPEQTIVVDAAGRTQAFRNSGFAALVVKDAVVDRLRSRTGRRPDVSRTDADVRIHLHLQGTHASLALDASGEPLAHRGYRPRGGPAPLSEALAAGCLALAGYDGRQPFVDPMAGTGTIAIEAALIATATAPGLRRHFACERWPCHSGELLASVRATAAAMRRSAPVPVLARDVNPRAVAAIRHNATAAGMGGVVRVERGEVRSLPVQAPGTVVLTNPPYGERLGEPTELKVLYRGLGDTFKQRLPECTVWILTGNPELAKSIGLRANRRVQVFNGPIECRLLRYEIVAGSPRHRSTG
ncbi:MAG TPA: THUMP domain-containing protein [Thermoanaerobaculaceae bacterium]|nr:THUMP domain-containing protein [Thermoanaerobaculaceae bacterium]